MIYQAFRTAFWQLRLGLEGISIREISGNKEIPYTEIKNVHSEGDERGLQKVRITLKGKKKILTPPLPNLEADNLLRQVKQKLKKP